MRRRVTNTMPSIRFHENFIKFCCIFFLLDKIVPKYAARNPSGIEIIPGVVYGNIASPTNIAFPATGFHTFGLNATRTIADTRPAIIPEMAPVVLKRFQYIVNNITGKFALAATANANETKKCYVQRLSK